MITKARRKSLTAVHVFWWLGFPLRQQSIDGDRRDDLACHLVAKFVYDRRATTAKSCSVSQVFQIYRSRHDLISKDAFGKSGID